MLETVFNILKVTVIIAVSAAFLVAILNLVNLIQTVVFGNIIGEIFALISMFLPFDASAVFGSLGIELFISIC